MASKLCQVCQRMFGSPEGCHRLGAHMYQHHKFGQLNASADAGCPFCKSLAKIHEIPRNLPAGKADLVAWTFRIDKPKATTTTNPPRPGTQAPPAKLSDHPFEKHKPRRLTGQIIDGSETKAVEFQIVAPANAPASRLIPQRPRLLEGGGDEAFQAASSWIKNCVQNHKSCHSGDPNFFPKRVIYVGDGTPSDPVRLLEKPLPVAKSAVSSKSGPASSAARAPKFVALSYSWGKLVQTYQTSNENVEAGKKQLPINKLEKTIQDAIQATRRLGFKYLWADSLCIIQNNEIDMKIALGSIKNIYENAAFTIVVEGKDCVSDGFLETKASPKTYSLPLYLGDKVPKGTVNLVARHHNPTRIGTKSRAWCFEEFLLAPKKIIYGVHEPRWTCRERENLTVRPTEITYANDGLPQLPVAPLKKPNEGAQLWSTYLMEYTSRHLTKRKDKGKAIAGIGQKLNSYVGDVYVPEMGVFKKQVTEGAGLILLWASDPSRKLPKPLVDPGVDKSTPPNAPSWSWMATAAPVRFLADKATEGKAAIAWAADPSKGPGILQIKAKTRELKTLTKKDWQHIKINPDVPHLPLTKCANCQQSFAADPVKHYRGRVCVAEASLLLLGDHKWAKWVGLVIVPDMTDPTKRRWVRVGSFEERIVRTQKEQITKKEAVHPFDAKDGEKVILLG
ncbi:heterokaryon incompatibility protein-domain-containing protein [Podospora australis]|uniref:Heterokaryon incompatibility protein-domain-containing protein n=1 Tax=Podospora australis TaxID=1536484 RepID=A0AAN7AI60_9PEZI|nr:heterokaryon incompatibility protein-domain-containing protein [Podospora australis]